MSCRHQKQRIVSQVCLTYKKLVLFVPISIFHSIKPRTLALPSTYSPKFMTSALNISAATPRFARGQSRISFDMLKSLRRVQVFAFQNNKHQNPKTLKPKTLN